MCMSESSSISEKTTALSVQVLPVREHVFPFAFPHHHWRLYFEKMVSSYVQSDGSAGPFYGSLSLL